jgi:hypothetical protein
MARDVNLKGETTLKRHVRWQERDLRPDDALVILEGAAAVAASAVDSADAAAADAAAASSSGGNYSVFLKLRRYHHPATV